VNRQEIIVNIMIAIGFFILGIIASPPFEDWWDANYGITPARFSNLLQNGKIEEFNNLGKQFHEKIEFDGIDLYNKNLENASLKSIILRNVNLFNSNLTNAVLDNSEISGNLSN
jgi:uncharacterized protein YjbI with pentapeptide repeats